MRLTIRWPQVFVAASLLFLGQANANAAVEDDAAAVIAGLHTALLETAQAAPDSSLDQRVEALAAAVRAAHDMERMARLTVGRYWRSWSGDQRQAFVAAFDRLSVTTYASRFASIGPDTFEIVSARAVDDSSAVVESLIHRPDGEPVELSYDLQLDNGRWRIVQIRADGVSELGLMRSSYYEILESDGYSGLIESIDSEIAGYYDR
jgi:phospholipid transport system substrate-binding protein